MKTLKILKGFHRPFSLLPACFTNFKLNRKTNHIWSREYIFDESCEYLLDNGDQYDWNKLYGWTFGGIIRRNEQGKKRFTLSIHNDSLRIVWRNNPFTKLIELACYYYIDGKRYYFQLATCKIGEKIKTSIEVLDNKTRITITTDKTYMKLMDFNESVKRKPLFGCGLYFGGNRTAPHNITVRYNDIDYQPTYLTSDETHIIK